MNRMRPAAALLPLPLVGLLLGARAGAAPSGASAAVSVDDLARCAAIHADTERLACFDRLSVTAQSQSRTPPGDSRSDSRSESRSESPALHPQPAPAADDVQSFGLTKHQLHEAPQGPQAIKALVKSISGGANGDVYLLLDNHQTWAFADANFLLRPGDAVLIKRAALGSFLMTTPGRRTYYVRRIE
jgi:hypothetical protein